MPGKLSALGNSPDQHQDATCDALNTELYSVFRADRLHQRWL